MLSFRKILELTKEKKDLNYRGSYAHHVAVTSSHQLTIAPSPHCDNDNCTRMAQITDSQQSSVITRVRQLFSLMDLSL